MMLRIRKGIQMRITPLALPVLALLCTTVLGQGTQPPKFHGAYLGQPASDYIDCSTGKTMEKWSAGTKGRGRDICDGKVGVIARSKKIDVLRKYDLDRLFFSGSKVTSIMITMHSEKFDVVVADMATKLGRKPDSTDPSTFQNAYGAKWSFNKAMWLGVPGVIVEDNVNNEDVPLMADGVAVTVMDANALPKDTNKPNSLD